MAYKDDQWIGYLTLASTFVGFVLVDKLTKQEVNRFAVGVVSSVIGFFLLIKLNTVKEVLVPVVIIPSTICETVTIGGFAGFINLSQKEAWRFPLGIAWTIFGLLCYAWSSSFNDLFGKWNTLKIILYMVFSLIVLLLVWFVKQLSFLRNTGARMAFLVWASTTVYSFFSDRAAKGTPDTYSIISCAAFAMMSFCCGFQELLYFFCGVMTAQLMKTNMMLGVMGIMFSHFLIVPDGNVLELDRLALLIVKPEVWRLVVVASAATTLYSTTIATVAGLLFKHGTGDSLEIFLNRVCIPVVSGVLFLKIPKQPYLRTIHLLKARKTILMSLWIFGSVLYIFLLDEKKHGNACSLVVWFSLAGIANAIEMPRVYDFFCCFLFINTFTLQPLGREFFFFVGVGEALFLGFICFHVGVYNSLPNLLGIQEDNPQTIIVEEAPEHSTDEDQPPQVVVIEVQDLPQFREHPPQLVRHHSF